MMVVPPDLEQVSAALGRETRRLVGLLGADVDLATAVPGLTWSVGQVAAHLCVVYRAFAGAIRGETLPSAEEPVEDLDLPAYLAALNNLVVEQVAFAGPAEAAETLADAAAELLSAIGPGADPLDPRPTPWYGPGMTRTVGTLAALTVSESLVHGYDLASALGRRRRLDPRSAVAVAPTVLSEMLPLLLDRRAARDLTVAFEVRVRGARPFVLCVAGGAAWAEHTGGRGVDCAMSLTASDALLVGFRRRPLWRAVASASALAYGRRPWLALRFPTLFHSA
jgi:uncharacterized protein (TIGR03083 family)